MNSETDLTARLGGGSWLAEYAVSYFRAADLLLRQREVASEPDQYALPLLYLHRHAVEVLVKDLVDACAYVAESRRLLEPGFPVLQGAKFGHLLGDALSVLRSSLAQVPPYTLPAGLTEAVAELERVEQRSPERLRYRTIKNGKEIVESFPSEMTVRVLELHKMLTTTFAQFGTWEAGLLREMYDECGRNWQAALDVGVVSVDLDNGR